MPRRGRRRFDLRKNHELSLKVRVPLNLLKPFIVSLPLSCYLNAPAPNGQALAKRLLASHQLPVGWSVSSNPGPSTTLYKVQCTDQQQMAVVTLSLVIHNNLTWTLTIGSIPVLPTHLPAVPSTLFYHHLVSLLLILDGCKLCIGNPDEKYLRLIEKKENGNLYDQNGIINFINKIVNNVYMH